MQILEQNSAKTKSSLRTLPLVGSFRDYFMQVKESQELNKQVCGNCYNYQYDGYVFVDELGELMKPGYLTSYFPEFIQRHGMKRMCFHDLRHCHASLLQIRFRQAVARRYFAICLPRFSGKCFDPMLPHLAPKQATQHAHNMQAL